MTTYSTTFAIKGQDVYSVIEDKTSGRYQTKLVKNGVEFTDIDSPNYPSAPCSIIVNNNNVYILGEVYDSDIPLSNSYKVWKNSVVSNYRKYDYNADVYFMVVDKNDNVYVSGVKTDLKREIFSAMIWRNGDYLNSIENDSFFAGMALLE